jgi:hypothetical protein
MRNMTVSKRFYFLAAVLLTGALCLHCKPSGAPSAPAESDSVRIVFSLEPGTVLKYKGNSTDDMNFYGLNIRSVHTDRVTLTVKEITEEGYHRIRVRFDESSDQIIRSGEIMEREGKVKPEGRTVEVEISDRGEVKEARGVIPGLPEGGLENYLSKWFAELPGRAMTRGGSWTEEISDSTAAGGTEGTVTMTLDGFGEKKGVAVAIMSGKAVTSVKREAGGGEIKGEDTADIEAAVALEGGYVVEYRVRREFSGRMTGVNPETAKEETTEVSRTSYTTVELIE